MNMSKTKVIRIGPIRETDRRFCRENNLDWVSKFTALCINYDTFNLSNITELNIETKMQTMEKMMQQWQQRNITPMGRVTVYKSLILSKIIHLLQVLPSPKKETLTNIERIAIYFIWRGKRHEINNQLICANHEQGRLNMFNLSDFDKSLKISWLQKILTQESVWKEFALKEKVDRLIWTCENYHNILLQKTNNSFWRSVIVAFRDWYSMAKGNIITQVEFQPLWGNTDMNMNFNYNLFNKNIIFVKDLYDAQGHPISQRQLEINIGSPIMFTTYHALWHAVPAVWKNSLKNNTTDYNF